MTPTSYSDLVMYFFTYSVLGWICETLYCSIGKRKFVPRGFLKGPYCPIYGFGALFIILITEPVQNNNILMFICILLITAALEYASSWLLEKLFHIRWWDYSNKRFNLNGRICLLNSVLFGVMGSLMVYFIHPWVSSHVALIPSDYERVLGSVLFAFLLIDFGTTLKTLIDFDEILRGVRDLAAELKTNGERYEPKNITANIERLVKDKAVLPESVKQRLESAARLPKNLRRLLRSYPNMSHTNLEENLEALRVIIKEKWGTDKLSTRFWAQLKKLGITFKESAKEHTEVSFATGVNFYKIVWVFFLSSILGYVIETIYCLVVRGHIESRQGVIYGPFCQVYGFGAVAMVLALHRLTHYKDRWIFLASAVIGGLVEYIISFAQECIFDSVSWDYSNQSANINGRISLLYMLFWGFLGVVLIKNIYPTMSNLIERIPNKQGVIFTWIIVVFLGADLLLSGTAVMRWSERASGAAPKNAVAVFFDEHYPDELLAEIYPNMVFK